MLPGITDIAGAAVSAHAAHAAIGFILAALLVVSGFYLGPSAEGGRIEWISSGALVAYLLAALLLVLAQHHDALTIFDDLMTDQLNRVERKDDEARLETLPSLEEAALRTNLLAVAFLESLVHGREDEIDQKIIGRVEEVAKKNNVSMACIATAWCIKKGVCPIIGLSSKERVDETIKNANYKLSDEDAKYLEEMYRPKERQGF